jgi:hypothetical protein
MVGALGGGVAAIGRPITRTSAPRAIASAGAMVRF